MDSTGQTVNPPGDPLETLRQAYSNDPENVETASRLAQLYSDRGWYNEAIEVYKSITLKVPENYSLMLEYGNVCFKHDDFEEAAALFQKLTVLKPRRVEGWNNLGIAQLSQNQRDAALESFKNVLELEPDNPGALLNLGNCYANKGMHEDACDVFHRVVELKPDFSDAWFNLGNALCALEKYPEAVEAFEKSMKYQREFPSALKNRGFAYERMGDLEAALDNYKKALELAKGDAALYVNIANVYVVQKKYDEAKSHYLLSVKLSPKEMAGWMGLRHLALLKGDVESYARSTIAVVNRLTPEALAESMMVLREFGHYDKVDELLNRLDAEAVAGDEIDAERLLAYQRTDSYPGKIIALSKSLRERSSPSEHLRSCLARYAFDVQDYSGALRYLESLAEPRMSDRKLLWQTCIALSHYDKAQKLLREYLDDHNDCFDAWYFLALVKIRRGEKEAAREFLIKALEFGFSDVDMLEKDEGLKQIFESLKMSGEKKKENE